MEFVYVDIVVDGFWFDMNDCVDGKFGYWLILWWCWDVGGGEVGYGLFLKSIDLIGRMIVGEGEGYLV